MAETVAFILVAAAMCGAALLAVLSITHVDMSGSAAVERDGLYRGTPAPNWSLADSSGHSVASPPTRALQMVVFTDHSLKSFPSVAEGLNQVTAADPGLDAVILLRSPSKIAVPVLRDMGVTGIPVVTGSPSLYGRYNVRVTPFVIFVDSAGLVRSSSLVNFDWQIMKLHALAGLPLTGLPLAAAPHSAGRLRRLISAARV
jgi:hypothetical protein